MKLHILGIAGTFMGGVAALARELGHEVEGSDQAVYPPMSTQLENLGIALSQAAGSMQFLVDGAWTKRSHVGGAAMSGLIAASLARERDEGTDRASDARKTLMTTR